MKDFVSGLVMTVLLVVLFSLSDPVHITLPSDGYGPQRPGHRGLVLPGGGDLPAEVASASASETERQEQTAAQEETRPQPTQTAQAVQTTNYTGGYNMPEMLSFWHGVAAVLIGETAALAVAAAWLRIQTKHLRSSGVKEEHK